MRVDLLNRHTMIFGLRGAGKSNITAHILDQEKYRNSLVWDLNHEHDEADRVLPKHRTGDELREEFDRVIQSMITNNDRDRRPDLLVVEEANRVAPNKGKTPESFLDLVDRGRHYDVGTVGLSRRPAQTDTDVVELADNLIVFGVRGKNDRSRLNRESEGLGDAAVDLDPYEFLVVNGMRDWARHEPVPEYDTTGEL